VGLGLQLGERRRGKREVPGRQKKRKKRGRKRGEHVMPVYVSRSSPLVIIGDKRFNQLMGREQRRLDVISYHPRKLWDEKRCVHTVNNILWNVLSSYL